MAKRPENGRKNGNGKLPAAKAQTKKTEALAADTEDGAGQFLTTNQGLRLQQDHDSLKAGERGPTLLEDFHFREKITHFDHERIPERVVHARGTAAHGYFQVYEPLAKWTKAKFLQDPAVKTPVFVRFSTVAGSRGSTDLARDARGFSIKFYTEEGNFDFVGNNIPVFFIQDAIKFPDFVHAVKPEPHNEIPQAASAHDTFWDFISLTPESLHMVMWVMSDRAIPRSFRMMEGFGIHTFRLVNEKGKSRFVKFHWKPLLGVHSVLWDEAQKISGVDPDFHRRDLWEAIDHGDYPEWELGLQIVEEEDEHKFDFDLLDPTKIIPEELVPVQRVGKLTLNRNPDSFFAETEQVAFHPGHLVPGIDFSDDPLLQGRLFSYLDTQLTRLGGPNFHEIPINRPIAPVHNNQRDGHMRQTINRGVAAYDPNTTGGGCPFLAGKMDAGFASYAEKVGGQKVRARGEKFFDHYSQAALFWNSQSGPEKLHLVQALQFELGKVEREEIRARVLVHLSLIDAALAERVALGLGASVPQKSDLPLNMNIPGGEDPKRYQSKPRARQAAASPALSMANTIKDSVKTRRIAVLAADGFDDAAAAAVKKALTAAGAQAKIVGPRLGLISGAKSAQQQKADFSLLTVRSVLFDAVYIPGGERSVRTLATDPRALEFVREAYAHCKAIAATGAGAELLRAAGASPETDGVRTAPDAEAAKLAPAFIQDIAQHRHWDREALGLSPEGSPTNAAPKAIPAAR